MAIRLRRLTGIKQGNFSFTYFRCPVFYGKKNKAHYEDLLRKVTRRLLMWKNKLLSFSGKYILTNHVLKSMHVYTLSAMNPSKKVIDQLHQIFVRFFWGKTRSTRGKHWVAWEDMCYPRKEGRLGLRSLHDMSKALFAKLWWRFRVSTSSLWSTYIGNKYCKKFYPVITRNSGVSYV